MERMTFQGLVNINSTFSVSDEEYEKSLNNAQERIEPREGVECPVCKNHEYTWKVIDGERIAQECACKAKRDNIKRVRESGLSEQLERCTFDSYETSEEWQQTAKSMVIRFLKDKDRKWLLMSGEPGSGKSHLCTAAAGRFMKAGANTMYMRWVDESTALKACVNDEYTYNKRMNKLKTCKVLYIDDFWKTQKGQMPTPADVKLAFDLLDYRYCNRGLITIISTERTVLEMIDIDAAVGSRIYEMTKGYRIEISGGGKNWRLK